MDWIKIHKKLLENDIIKDHLAFVTFMFILLKANEDGVFKTGRFLASEQLNILPDTFYKILKRLEKKYKMVTLSSNNKFTEIRVLNWSKYQDYKKKVTQGSNNKVTTKSQQSNTLIHREEIRDIEKENIEKEVSLYVEEFNKLFGKKYTVTGGRSSKMKTRLTKFSLEQILLALKNMASVPFYHGKNDRKWEATPDYLIETDEKVDKWCNYQVKAPKVSNIPDFIKNLPDYYDELGTVQTERK